MKLFLFCTLMSALVFQTAFGASPSRRFGSGPLTRSVQNEADAAIDRGRLWLLSKQLPDGSWNGDVRLTAICALAIHGDAETLPSTEQEAVSKAVKWLLHASENVRCNGILATAMIMAAYAWRDMVFQVMLHPTPVLANVLTQSMPLTNSPAAMAMKTEWPIAEAKLMRGVVVERPISTSSDNAERFISVAQCPGVAGTQHINLIAEALAADFDTDRCENYMSNPEAGWWLARAINRAKNGQLTLHPDAQGEVMQIMWRRTMAGRCIVAQCIDDHGFGNWGNSIEKTAFAILLLNEL